MERLTKIEQHLATHPTDYQSVISFLKLRSKEFERENRQKRNEKLKLLAEIRRNYEKSTR